MEHQKKLELENAINKFDFTKFELNYIIDNCNFNDRQLEVFKRLTDKRERQTITKMSIEMNLGTATISRIIKQIKNKIKRIL